MEYKDYYKILGVPKKADAKEIKRAYRRLARRYHPDRNPGDRTAENKFKEINEAYEVIGSPENRTKYDQLGRNYHRFQQMGGNPSNFDFSQWFSGDRHGNVNLGDMFGAGRGGRTGFSDFFDAIFGSGGVRQAGGRPGNAYGGRGRDVEHTVSITLDEAYHGTSRTLSQDGNRFTAKIPAGAKNGTKIRLRGKGGSGSAAGGDLYLVVRVEPHPTFKRDGPTLRVDVDVDVVTAVLGGKVPVPTLTGPVSLTIPAGTQGGQTIRLRGRGMPHLRDEALMGDLLATVRIRVPKELNEEQRALYEKLAQLSPDPATQPDRSSTQQ